MKKLQILLLIIFSTVFVLHPNNVVRADTLSDLQQRQADLNRQIEENQAQLNSKKKEIKTIQDLSDNLDSQIKLTQTEIDAASNKINLTDKQINEMVDQINQKQKELDIQKENLYEAMRVIYETPQRSTVEIVVGSDSLSEIVDRAQYIESLEYQIETTINTIMQLKAELESKRNQLEKDKTDLESQKKTLVDKRRNLDIQQAEKSRLLSQAVAEKANTQSTLNRVIADRDNVSAEIYALRKSQGGYISGSSNYPFSGASTSGVDDWGFYYRQCTSYAAWYFNSVEGKYFVSWRWLGYDRSSNGGDWPDLARHQGYSVSSTPQPGAIVSWPAGGIFGSYGHVAIVESVNGDGTFEVSQYNWDPYSFSTMHVSSSLASSASFIY